MYNMWGQVDTEFPIQFDSTSQALDSDAFGNVLDQILIQLTYERNSLSANAVHVQGSVLD